MQLAGWPPSWQPGRGGTGIHSALQLPGKHRLTVQPRVQPSPPVLPTNACFTMSVNCCAAKPCFATLLPLLKACRAATQYRQQSDEGRPILGAGALSSSCGGDGGTRAVWPDAAADATGSVSQQAARVLPGWSYRQLAAASAVCLAGGCAAGTLGIGGGMIMAPLFLGAGCGVSGNPVMHARSNCWV